MRKPNNLKNGNYTNNKPNTSVHIGQLKRALKMLHKAKRPLFLAGGGVNIADANQVFTEVVEKTGVPVITTVMIPAGSLIFFFKYSQLIRFNIIFISI